MRSVKCDIFLFQHTAARRRLLDNFIKSFRTLEVSTHSRPKAAAFFIKRKRNFVVVSTHSRPKAAALYVSTHSRPKAAAFVSSIQKTRSSVSTHSRPKAAAILC